jgi:hypothetical protein
MKVHFAVFLAITKNGNADSSAANHAEIHWVHRSV